MIASHRLAVAGIMTLAGSAPAQDLGTKLGSLLKPGVQFEYTSGSSPSIWNIDGVTRDTVVAGAAGCIVIRIRTSAAQTAPTIRTHCVRGTTMLDWWTTASELRPAQPLARGEIVIPRTGGGRVVITAYAASSDTISGNVLTVLPTVVTTYDSTGTPIRRLRERFAIELATATRGVFEVPDSATNGWKVERSFILRGIKR